MTNTMNAENKQVRRNALFHFIARRNNQVADLVAARPQGQKPQLVSDIQIYNMADYGDMDTGSAALIIAANKINKAVATKHEGYMHIYTFPAVAVKYREVISHREDDMDTMLAVIVKDWMSKEQARATVEFAKAVRAAQDAGIYLSVIDARSLSFLEFSNPQNIELRAGNVIEFVNGENSKFKTYGLNVTGKFKLVPSTRRGEEGKLLLDIRNYGSKNNPNSVLNFARQAYTILSNKLAEGNSWNDVLNQLGGDNNVSYDTAEFDEVIA